MKKLLLLALLMLALVVTAVACTDGDTTNDTTVGDTTVETPTEAPTEDATEDATEAPTEDATEAPTEGATEGTTETPTEEATEAPTEEPTEEPTQEPETEPQVPHYDNYNVPQDQWTVTGHCPGIVGKEGHANSGMVAAGGVESGALIHQGAVALGEIDLSKYSKVVIMWGCDNSPVTVGHYEQSANNRIMLVSADVNGTAPADGTIIAGGTYELGGWAVQAFEIDLTEVDYNGPVYLCIDTLPGTFALFASVEFIGAEIPAEEIVEPVDIDLTTVTATGSWPTVDVPVNAPALGLGEDQHVIALHYGSIVLGEMDLSKFSKVTVTYVTPCGELNGSNFNAEYDATGKRVLLLNTLSAIQEGTTFEMLPAEDAIITTNHYEMSSVLNEVKTVEIDLTEIDYNGQVILSFDARNANNEFGAIGYLVYVIGITFA